MSWNRIKSGVIRHSADRTGDFLPCLAANSRSAELTRYMRDIRSHRIPKQRLKQHNAEVGAAIRTVTSSLTMLLLGLPYILERLRDACEQYDTTPSIFRSIISVAQMFPSKGVVSNAQCQETIAIVRQMIWSHDTVIRYEQRRKNHKRVNRSILERFKTIRARARTKIIFHELFLQQLLAETEGLCHRPQRIRHVTGMLAGDFRPIAEELLAQNTIRREAVDALTSANAGLVVSIARQYQGHGIDLIDLIGEGNLGLMTAVFWFDPARGTFATYASWRIHQHLSVLLKEQSKIIRTPRYLGDVHQRALTVVRDRPELEGNDRAIAKELGVTVRLLQSARAVSHRKIVSLDEPIGEQDGKTRGDFIEDPDAFERVILAADAGLRTRVDRLFRCLPSRDADMMRYRYGFIDGIPRSLQEVADIFGLTRERIRQIDGRSLKKLRGIVENESSSSCGT